MLECREIQFHVAFPENILNTTSSAHYMHRIHLQRVVGDRKVVRRCQTCSNQRVIDHFWFFDIRMACHWHNSQSDSFSSQRPLKAVSPA